MKQVLFIFLSLLYGLVVAARNWLFDIEVLRSTKFDTPIVSLGNITAGGTGKTPHTEYLVSLLTDKVKVAVLSRGYKRQTKGFLLSNTGSTVLDVGDEPLQIKLKYPEVTVAVDESRVRGIKNLLALPKSSPDVVILDDAFQHRYVIPGINILLIDYNRMITSDYLLPRGMLREPAKNRLRADMIIVTKCPDEITPDEKRQISRSVDIKPHQSLYFTTLSYGRFMPVFQIAKRAPEGAELQSMSVLLVTGIANPKPLEKYMEKLSQNIIVLRFPDHHSFNSKDILKITESFNKISGPKVIVTTEKDMVRLREVDDIPEKVKERFFYIPVQVRFICKNNKAFNDKIIDYVRENKRDCELYSQQIS